MLELEAIAELARDEGLVARFGRKVLEVLPPVGSNKGTRGAASARGRRADARARRRRRHDRSRRVPRSREAGAPLRVAVLAPESPAELAEHAELVLGSTGEFLELLRQL